MQQQRTNVKITNSFLPADEWIYYKFYGGPSTCETLLLMQIMKLVQHFLLKGLIDSFFFIRYSDPDHHLRVRFHLKDIAHTAEVINKVNQEIKPLVLSGMISNVILDSYKRETNRYGEETICLVEELFFQDSLFVIDCHKMPGKREHWQISIALIDKIFDLFGFDADEKLRICEYTVENFSMEFDVNKVQKRLLDIKYRYYQTDIDTIFSGFLDTDPIEEAIKKHLDITAPVINEIVGKINKKQRFLHALVGSIVHMHINRMFQEQQRAYEFVMYYFLFKTYRSQIARLSKKIS